MALSVSLPSATELSSYVPVHPQNDRPNNAFEFWKLPVEFRAPLASSIAASEKIVRRFLFEEYLSEHDRRPAAGLALYYLIKGLIPVRLRHRINAIAIRTRRQLSFPHWPCETALVDYWRKSASESLHTLGLDDAPHIAFWPDGNRCAIVLTHDVESPLGLERITRMSDLEEKYGFHSAFNFPLNQYPIEWRQLEDLQRRGFEFGAHGLAHDGRLFRSHEDFAALAPILQRFAQEREFRGFRSPSTLRRIEWITQLDFDFDSSFADTDPYEPQPGGSCSVFPFFLGDMIELPYTVPQDHTLIHLLRRDPLPVWTAKAQWIASLGGMILTLTHPDYSGTEPYLSAYEELLKRLNDVDHAWRALPSETAAWWRHRHGMRLSVADGEPMVTGVGSERAVVRRLGEDPLAR
jgi:peptidoglycan/xylan/chitin deacetylase (PgdA/CDA1 family)